MSKMASLTLALESRENAWKVALCSWRQTGVCASVEDSNDLIPDLAAWVKDSAHTVRWNCRRGSQGDLRNCYRISFLAVTILGFLTGSCGYIDLTFRWTSKGRAVRSCLRWLAIEAKELEAYCAQFLGLRMVES